MKRCASCGEDKPLNEFYQPATYCKECVKARSQKRYYNNHEENREKNRLHAIAYRKEHPDKMRDAQRRWEQSHLDSYLLAKRKTNQVRRARKLEAFVEVVDPMTVYERDNGVCQICDEPISEDYHLDHIVPLSRGGEHSYANIQLAHPHCNLRKGSKI